MLRNPAYSQQYNQAVGTVEPYKGTDHTVQRMMELARGDRGERSIKVRRHTEQIVGNLRPKDYSSEIIAICKWWGNAGRYTRDPLHVEMLRDPERLVDDAMAGKLACDCFPEGALVLRDDYTFTPIEHVRVGDRIWGYDRWSTVEAHGSRGVLPIDAIRMNNGSWLRLSPDHKVYVLRCPKHPDDVQSRNAEGKPKWCSCRDREQVRIAVAEVREGQVLLCPERLPFGREELDPDRAYVEGLYLSEGWHSDYQFNISGMDGCPKEAQKLEVEEICSRLGVNTCWLPKSIAVLGKEWASRVALMGARAPQKRALSIDLGEAAAAQILRGIMADSGKNTTRNALSRTFTTTSRDLMLQTRVLHKMFGISCGYSYIEEHGGLGKNPIWRLSTRQRTDGRNTKLLRVSEVLRGVTQAPCYDITTDDHYVYMPEHDVTVSNCDEFALAIGTSCLAIGAPVRFVTVGFSPRLPGQRKVHTHVFATAQDPRTKQWWVLDPVAGRRTQPMLERVKQYSIFEV